MNRSIKIQAFLTAFLVATLLLCGCSQNPQVAGGDDYPNSVNTLGKHAARDRGDTSEWNAYRDAPSNAPGVYDTTAVPDSVPQSQATTASDTFAVFTDSNSGRVTLVHIHVAGAFQSVDSTVYRPDLSAFGKPLLVSVMGFVHETNGTEKRYRFQDGDGDGFLSVRPQGSNIASFHLTVVQSGETLEKNLRLEAGADFNFNAHADNRLLAFEQTIRKGADTLSHLLLQDADGDSSIFNPGASSNRVDAQQKTRDTLTGSKTSLFYRFTAFADSTKNQPLRYHQLLESNGRTQETWALGHDSLPDFAAGDSGWVRTVFTPASGDSLAQAINLYSVLLANPPRHFSGNRLLSVDRIRTYRLGAVSKSHFHLQPGAVVSDGGFASTGGFTARLDFTSGKWIQMQGDATSAEMSGLTLDSQGQQGTVHFDLEGGIKSLAP